MKHFETSVNQWIISKFSIWGIRSIMALNIRTLCVQTVWLHQLLTLMRKRQMIIKLSDCQRWRNTSVKYVMIINSCFYMMIRHINSYKVFFVHSLITEPWMQIKRSLIKDCLLFALLWNRHSESHKPLNV